MSRIQGRPFIELVIGTLNEEKKKKLLDLVNGTDEQPAFRSLINSSNYITDADKNDVSHIVLETWHKTFTGYLIYNNTYCVLISYVRNTQDLNLLSINLTNQTYTTIRQSLTILELRYVLNDVSEHITPGDIDSGDAPKGQVLTADGESGASWENRVEYLNLESESGNLTNAQIEVAKQDNVIITLDDQFYYKNSQSDEAIVFKAPAKVVDDDTIAEKVVIDLSDNTYSYSYEVVATGGSFDPTYDDEINDSSTNAVQNKVIYEELEKKANVDGYYETFGYARRSGVADNLYNEEGKLLDPNVSESAGTVYADQPFVQRATAMTMNAYLNNELISVASGVEERKKDEAFSIVRNQQMRGLNNFGIVGGATKSYADGVLTVNTVADATSGITSGSIPFKGGHKYIRIIEFKGTEGVSYGFNGEFTAHSATGSWEFLYNIVNQTNDGNHYLAIATNVESTFQVRNCRYIDITQWFASRPTIAVALTRDSDVKWFLQQYPKALSLDYDAGTIIDTETYEYQTTGINLWDEEWELGTFNTTTGVNIASTYQIRSKNPIKIFPNTQYYFNAPINLWVMFLDINMQPISITLPSGYQGDGNSVQLGNTDNKQIFTTPINAVYCKFFCQASYGTTYKNDIQICNHFTQTQIEQTYHKFEIHKDTVDWSWTSTGKGKSAGSVADTKDYVLGKNIEKVGSVDLGTLNWTLITSFETTYFYTNDLNSIIKRNWQNNLCSKYKIGDYPTLINNNKILCVDDNGRLNIRDDSYNDVQAFKQAMSGVILNYALATPIESDMVGDEIITTVQENDYGNEVKVPASGNMFSGSATTIFYQDNVLRQIYNNKSNIDGLQEDVNTLEAKIPDAPTTDGTYVLKATVSGGVATYSWVLEE